jgi:hypothetical protein
MTTPTSTSRWQEWVIALTIVVLAVVGFLTVFDDELARWRGVDQVQKQPTGPTANPPVAGNTQGTL